MASKLKQRQARIEQDKEKVEATLRQNTRVHKDKPIFTPVSIAYELIDKYGGRVINKLDDFNRSLKTQDPDRVRLLYATHLFTRYKVPPHISDIWIELPTTQERGRYIGYARRRDNQQPQRVRRFADEQRETFFVVGAGGSPAKTVFKDILSKKEVHRLLTCSFGLNYIEVINWAIARTFTDDNGVALRIARSKIAQKGDYHHDFWRDVIRFFSANPIDINEINDIVDFLLTTRRQNPDFTMKGRTLVSVRNLVRLWHAELRLKKRIGGSKWEGLMIPDWKHVTKAKSSGKELTWTVTQILNGNDLAEEGSAMHHCVSMYKPYCESGRTGIFSVRRLDTIGNKERRLTIEVNDMAEVKQIRGFANRSALPEEVEIVDLWMRENMLSKSRYAY